MNQRSITSAELRRAGTDPVTYLALVDQMSTALASLVRTPFLEPLIHAGAENHEHLATRPMTDTTDLPIDLQQRIAAIFAERDREHMDPTIRAHLELLREYPDNAVVLYEVGGSYDTAGEEQTAIEYYERAMDAGLTGDVLRRCLIQYGSTLRNLGRFSESVEVLRRARRQYPESDSVRVFLALSQHAGGHADDAVADLLELVVDRLRDGDLPRYAAIRGLADSIRNNQPSRPA
jgi:tetratricopeptide (TPR) repeat protein